MYNMYPFLEEDDMRLWTIAVLFVSLFAAATLNADPNGQFSATAPTQYEDGNMIPASDVLTYKVMCSNSQGGPYLYSFDVPNLVAGTQVDVAACVQGIPGAYYFVATATSSTWMTESSSSNETTKTWSAFELGKTPRPPTLFTIQ